MDEKLKRFIINIPSNPRLVSLFKACSRAASVFAILVGFLVLAGWILDIPPLKSVFPGLVTMKVNTALSFALAGLSLQFIGKAPKAQSLRRLAQGCALIVSLIGLVTLGEYFAGRDLGIDQLLIEEPAGAVRTVHPGRMAPVTAVSFLLIGFALLFLDVKTSRGSSPAESLALATAAISFFSFVGHLFSVEFRYGIASYANVELHTAVTFIALSAGVLLVRPDRGWMGMIASDGPGGVMARRLLPALIGVPPVLGWLLLQGDQVGLFVDEFGVALFVVMTVLVFSVLVWWNASAQFQRDVERLEEQAALHKSEEMQRNLFEQAPDPILVTSQNGRIVQANAQTEEMFGYNRAELIGESVELLVPNRLREKHVGHRATYYSEPRTRPMGKWADLFVRRKDGSEVPVDISLSPCTLDGQIHVISVMRDVTQRKRLELTLRESQRTLLTLVSNLPGMAYRGKNDKERTLEFASDGCRELTGYEAGDLVQTKKVSYAELIHRDDRETVWSDVQAAIQEKRQFRLIYRIIAANGTEKWVSEQGIAVFAPDGDLDALEGLITDITERKQAEVAFQQHMQEIQALHEIGQAIINSGDLNTVLEIILEKTLSIGAFDIGVIRLIDPVSMMLKAVISRGYRNPENIRSLSPDPKNPTSGKAQVEVFKGLGAYVTENIPTSTGFRTFKQEGVESAIVVPVRSGGEIIGTMQLGIRTLKKFSPEEIHLLETIGDQLGVALQQFRLKELTEKNLERIHALHEIDKAITSSLDLQSVLDILMEKIDLVLPYSATAVRLFNPKSALLEPVACRNLDEEEWKAEQWRGGRGIPNVVFETKAPVMMSNVQRDPRTRDPEFFRRHGLVSYLGVPLIVQDEILGVLSFYTKEEHQFSSEEVDFLTTLAGQAAIVIHNAQLYEKIDFSRRELELTNQYLEKSLKQLSGLYAAFTPLAPSESIHETMDGIIERIMEASGADAALIRLRDEETGTYPIASHRGFADYHLKSIGAMQPGGAADWVYKNREPIIAPDITLEPRLKGKVQLQLGLLSCAMFPLEVHDEVRGIIHLSSRKLGYFDEEQKDHLIAIARQMSIALENRELFDNLKASKDELEKAIKVKDEFLSVISHELRTPLNVVMGYAGMMKDGMLGEINPQQEEALGKMISRANDQLALVNNILYATVLESEKINVDVHEFVLGDFLNQLKSAYDISAKKLAILWECAEPLVPIRTDSTKLKLILQNLIDNALKFTASGEVKVSARVVEATGTRQQAIEKSSDASRLPPHAFVEFKVQDTGVGIPKDQLPLIFERFHQVDSSETRSFGGVGMGLYIVKQFTELLGGTVQVESEPDRGSTFTVTIPC